jgi:hypothetical protein
VAERAGVRDQRVQLIGHPLDPPPKLHVDVSVRPNVPGRVLSSAQRNTWARPLARSYVEDHVGTSDLERSGIRNQLVDSLKRFSIAGRVETLHGPRDHTEVIHDSPQVAERDRRVGFLSPSDVEAGIYELSDRERPVESPIDVWWSAEEILP